MAVEIPLFPLGVVLFPHMQLGLHIFEERYRTMMRDCQEQGRSFGIVAIREGVEMFGAATPYPVGTLAQFQDVEALEDGQFRLMVSGASRFRIETLVPGRPYLVGNVRYLEDLPGEELAVADLTARVGEAFLNYAATLDRLNGKDDPGDLDISDDPELLSYTVAAALQVELPVKQALLEIDSAAARLRRCLSLLQREVAVLGVMVSHRALPLNAFSPN